MGEISNFYNLSPSFFILCTHIPPILATHTSKFHSCQAVTFWVMIIYFGNIGLFSKSISSHKFKVYDIEFFFTVGPSLDTSRKN